MSAFSFLSIHLPHASAATLSLHGMHMPGALTGSLTATYDPWYVLLSVVLAVCSAYAALDLAARVQQSRASGTRTIWLACGALALGSGIWSMHYVGMLAFRLPVAVRYNEMLVMLSLLAAVAASGLALFLAARRTMSIVATALGSVCLGGGIASMHYIGMAAMRTAAMPMYSVGTVALSVVLAIVIAFVALRATFAHKHVTHAFTWRKLGLAVVLGAAIPSVHYVGMAAATWHPMQRAVTDEHLVVFNLFGALAVPFAACVLLLVLVRLNATVDATFREQLEQQTRSEQRYRNILSSAFDAFIGISPAGIITDWNAQAERTFGWTAEEALGRSVDGMVQLCTTDRSMSHFLHAHTRDEVEGRIEVEGRHKNGSTFAGEMAMSVLEVDGGLLVAAFVHDVTERKNADQHAREARSAAEASNRAKSEFLANMSHEIRTPLNGIIGMNDLVLDSVLTQDQRDCLETVRVSADQLLSVISDILDFSKIEAGKLDLEHVRFDLRECVESTLKTMALRADEKNLELLCDVGLDVPEAVFSDATRVRQVLTNLLGNAIKFTHQGEVMVQVRTAPSRSNTMGIHFTVSDTGIGIPPAKLDSIFEAFKQADTSTTRQFGGTGLGLTISRHMVEMMGGRIWVESEVGAGSRFHFALPMEVAEPIACLPVDPRPCVSMQGVRALIIDDNATNRRILEGLLTRWQMSTVSACDGASALRALQLESAAGTPFRLVLTDVHMPTMDGFTFVEELKKRPGLDAPTVMMLSSSGHRADAARCRELGVAAYLLKPVRQRELQDAIARALNLQSIAEPPAEAAEEGLAKVEDIAPAHAAVDTLDILLAEDNEVNRKLALRVLERRGHRVSVARNGREAVQQVATRVQERRNFDLVLMDVQMPELSGMEATAAIRAQEEADGGARHQRIVAMTALVMTGDRERCLRAGMDDYISKPFRMEDLDAILERGLQVKRARGESISKQRPAALQKEAPAMAQERDTLDSNDLMTRIGEDGDLLMELTQVLADDAPTKMHALRQSLQQQNASAFASTAHSLKGALAMLSAGRGTAQAAELERRGRAGEIDNAAPLLDALQQELHAVQQQLNALCERTVGVSQ